MRVTFNNIIIKWVKQNLAQISNIFHYLDDDDLSDETINNMSLDGIGTRPYMFEPEDDNNSDSNDDELGQQLEIVNRMNDLTWYVNSYFNILNKDKLY